MEMFFTSDHHFSHSAIIKYTDRPFVDVDEMDQELIKRWNEVVGPNDSVFHLGDFVLGGPDKASQYFAELNGQIHALANHWHHDKKWLPANVGPCSEYVSKSGHRVIILPPMVVLELKEYRAGQYNKPLVLCHYQLMRWDRRHYGSWHLFGHSHGKVRGEGLSFDCGVDTQNFTPIPLHKVATIMEMRGEKL